MAMLALTLDLAGQPGETAAVRIWEFPDDAAELVAGLLTGMLGPPHEALAGPAAVAAAHARARKTADWVVLPPQEQP